MSAWWKNICSPARCWRPRGAPFRSISNICHSRAGDAPVWDIAVRETATVWCASMPQGDVLIFMPGAYEIARTVQAARDKLGQQFVVFPLHGELPPNEQDAAVARYERRKIVVATNVAETSLTIDGVRLVVDSGLARIPRFDPYRGINTLLIEKISRAAADQRAGRAGRTAPGHCLRLWTAHEQEGAAVQELAEVKRLDLAEVILTLKASGLNDVKNFRWLEAPEARALARAETLLADLGAIDDATGAITDARTTHVGIPGPSALRAHALRGAGIRLRAAGGADRGADPGTRLAVGARASPQTTSGATSYSTTRTESDFFVLMRAWRYAEGNGYQTERCRRMGIHAQAARQVGPLFEQFLRIAGDEGFGHARKTDRQCGGAALRSLGFFRSAGASAWMTNRCVAIWSMAGAAIWRVRAWCAMRRLMVVSEVREVESSRGRDRNLNVMLNLATAVKEEWLRELFPRDFTRRTVCVTYDPALRRVVARVERRFRDLMLEESLTDNPPLDEAAAISAREVSAGRCVLENWNDAVEQWILRVNRLREWMAELALPAIDVDGSRSHRRAYLPWGVQLCADQGSCRVASGKVMAIAAATAMDRRLCSGAHPVAARPPCQGGVFQPTARRRCRRASKICTTSKMVFGSPTGASRCAFKCWRRVIGRCR